MITFRPPYRIFTEKNICSHAPFLVITNIPGLLKIPKTNFKTFGDCTFACSLGALEYFYNFGALEMLIIIIIIIIIVQNTRKQCGPICFVEGKIREHDFLLIKKQLI